MAEVIGVVASAITIAELVARGLKAAKAIHRAQGEWEILEARLLISPL